MPWYFSLLKVFYFILLYRHQLIFSIVFDNKLINASLMLRKKWFCYPSGNKPWYVLRSPPKYFGSALDRSWAVPFNSSHNNNLFRFSYFRIFICTILANIFIKSESPYKMTNFDTHIHQDYEKFQVYLTVQKTLK